MPRPTARVLALLEILQTGGTHTAATLAGRLGVDERTLRRYVEHLADLDIPVEPVRGRYGGYRLAPGFRMPPLMLTDEEALAVLLALHASDAAGSGSATAKIRRVLPRAAAVRLAALLATVAFTGEATPETSVLLTFATAARDRRPVAMRYTDRGGRHSDRIVHPYGIVAHAGHWYVTGADPADGEIRSFRLDRVGSASVTVGTFDPPAGFDPVQRVRAEVPYRHAVSVRVEGSAEHVRNRLPAGLAVLEELPGEVRVRLRAERLDWVPVLLAGLDRPFVVEEPPELRSLVHALARRLAGA